MVEKKVGKLLHGGEDAKVDQSWRFWHLYSWILEPVADLT
jgi:hypothetical protein